MMTSYLCNAMFSLHIVGNYLQCNGRKLIKMDPYHIRTTYRSFAPRIHFLYRYVPKDKQFITSAHNNNSPIEGITPIEYALVLQ